MSKNQSQNELGETNLIQAKLGGSSLNQTKQVRLYVSRPQHQELLRSVSAQLGSSNLKDGLEHILNCWLVGNVPTGSSAIQSPVQTAILSSDDVDEFDSLISFE